MLQVLSLRNRGYIARVPALLPGIVATQKSATGFCNPQESDDGHRRRRFVAVADDARTGDLHFLEAFLRHRGAQLLAVRRVEQDETAAAGADEFAAQALALTDK